MMLHKHVDPNMWTSGAGLGFNCWTCNGAITGPIYSAPTERTLKGTYVVYGLFHSLACVKRYLVDKKTTMPQALHLLSMMAKELYHVDTIAIAPSPELLMGRCPSVEHAMSREMYDNACGDSSQIHNVNIQSGLSRLRYLTTEHEIIKASSIKELNDAGYISVSNPGIKNSKQSEQSEQSEPNMSEPNMSEQEEDELEEEEEDIERNMKRICV
jgi:hypothetical protein